MSNLIVHHVLGWLWSKNYPTPGFTLKNGYFLYMFHSSKSRTHFLGLCCTAGNLRLIQDMPQKNQSHNMSQASHAASWEEILPNTDNLQNRTQFSSGFVKKNKAWNHESTKALDTALLMLRDVAGKTMHASHQWHSFVWTQGVYTPNLMVYLSCSLLTLQFRLFRMIFGQIMTNPSHFVSRKYPIFLRLNPTQTWTNPSFLLRIG